LLENILQELKLKNLRLLLRESLPSKPDLLRLKIPPEKLLLYLSLRLLSVLLLSEEQLRLLSHKTEVLFKLNLLLQKLHWLEQLENSIKLLLELKQRNN
jgi:hypothetical protein